MYLLDSSAWLAHLLGESATDVTIAQAAIRLRVTTPQRLPTGGALLVRNRRSIGPVVHVCQ